MMTMVLNTLDQTQHFCIMAEMSLMVVNHLQVFIMNYFLTEN